jgi:hypothetical protein
MQKKDNVYFDSFSSGGIHPVIIKLGLQYAEGVICGSNARCLAMLAAFKKVKETTSAFTNQIVFFELFSF